MYLLSEEMNPSVLSEANQENYLQFVRCLAESGQVYLDESQDLFRFYSYIEHPLMNAVTRVRVAPDRVPGVIAEVEAYYKEFGQRPMWMLWPNDQPAELTAYLTRGGWKETEEMPCMAISLRRLPEVALIPDGLTITRASGHEDLVTFSTTHASVLHLNDQMANAYVAVCESLGFGPGAPAISYIGWYEGKPVATCFLFLAAGVAGIYNVATVQGYRRRGFGKALTLQGLLDARDLGYHVGVLQATKLGASVYREIGFVETGMYRSFMPCG